MTERRSYQQYKQKLDELIQNNYTEKDICEELGISQITLNSWRIKLMEDKGEFIDIKKNDTAPGRRSVRPKVSKSGEIKITKTMLNRLGVEFEPGHKFNISYDQDQNAILLTPED